jgi:CO/xanthine dehydrogenase Mo-binding subunit
VIGFAEVEVDTETGGVRLVDFLGVGDVGTVVNPRSLLAQIKGGSCLGIAHALFQKSVVEPRYGVSLTDRFHYSKPLTILDIPAVMQADALDMADPDTPVGARGVGEPPVGGAYGAVMSAIQDAVGEDVFRRAPVTADVILMSLEHGRRMHEPLRMHV